MTDTRNDTISVDASNVTVSLARKREMFVLRNSSVGAINITICLSDSSAAVASKGIVLAQGASYAESANLGFTVWEGTISAIASGAGGVLSIFER